MNILLPQYFLSFVIKFCFRKHNQRSFFDGIKNYLCGLVQMMRVWYFILQRNLFFLGRILQFWLVLSGVVTTKVLN